MSESFRGRFLVAGPRLRDRNFFKTVVLLAEHTEEGAMGFVVNRPSSLTVANALAGHFELPETSEIVFVGGPVEPADLFLVHCDPAWAEESAEVIPGVYVTSSPTAFSSVVDGDAYAERPRRVISGYAGWGPGQLEDEMATGDWLLANASHEEVFSADPYEVWDALKGRVAAGQRVLSVSDETEATEHPEWN